MASHKQRASRHEFPILEANALYAGEIRGNCLFNALSDQLFGDQEMHEVLRAATIEHMRDNANFYRQYMVVNSVRRNPKRKTTIAFSSRIDTSYYTEEQLQQQFAEHVDRMGQPGEWADNMEVSAFASALNVHVRLWQADYTYLISPRLYYIQSNDLSADDDRQTLHIAYHSWEHYSSVRNVNGPHLGLPKVSISPGMINKKRTSPSLDGIVDNEQRLPRARKRRSPLPVFDSDSTHLGTDSSSDESNGSLLSHRFHLGVLRKEHHDKPQKLTLKLRGLRTSDPGEYCTSSRASSVGPALAPPQLLPPTPSLTLVTNPDESSTRTLPRSMTNGETESHGVDLPPSVLMHNSAAYSS